MPLSTQHSLLCFLLIWTTIISIVQAVFLILFFTQGHSGLNRIMAEAAQLTHRQDHSTSSSRGTDRLSFGTDKMLTFKAITANDTIKWSSKKPDASLISESEILTIKKGGCYYLNLQVTLQSCEERRPRHNLSLKVGGQTILQGWINSNTNSTCSISKVQPLSTGEKLTVTIDPPSRCLNYNETVTHLNIIYMAAC